MAAALETHGLMKRFGGLTATDNVTFRLETGARHALIGPNGAGKTTFFNTLTGSVKPSRGRIRLDGTDIGGLGSYAIARKGVARSFQIMTLFNDFTAQENVMVALPAFRARGFDMRRAVAGDAALADEANAVLASVGLAEKAEISAKLLSYGERRALEIAVALAQRPRVLCLDEPTSGLGTDGTLRIAELIRSLKKKLTIIAVEHDMRFLFSLADRISVIHWGQVVARGTPRELQENPWVKRSNLGSFE